MTKSASVRTYAYKLSHLSLSVHFHGMAARYTSAHIAMVHCARLLAKINDVEDKSTGVEDKSTGVEDKSTGVSLLDHDTNYEKDGGSTNKRRQLHVQTSCQTCSL